VTERWCPGNLADMSPRPLALVTGASRSQGIGAAIAIRLAQDGVDVGRTFWRAYDERMPWSSDAADSAAVQVRDRGSGRPDGRGGGRPCRDRCAVRVFGNVVAAMDCHVTGLILSHCESSGTDLMSTTAESLDQHYAVNVRASLLLIREYAGRLPAEARGGRIVALTSDHTVGNFAYGSTKASLDRIGPGRSPRTRRSGRYRKRRKFPEPRTPGWMSQELTTETAHKTPLGPGGNPSRCRGARCLPLLA